MLGDCRRTGRTARARTQTAAHSGAPITEFSKKLQERKGQAWQVSGEEHYWQREEQRPWGRDVW